MLHVSKNSTSKVTEIFNENHLAGFILKLNNHYTNYQLYEEAITIFVTLHWSNVGNDSKLITSYLIVTAALHTVTVSRYMSMPIQW
jgi:hypothetical protein